VLKRPIKTHENLRGKVATFLTLYACELFIPLRFVRENLALKTLYSCHMRLAINCRQFSNLFMEIFQSHVASIAALASGAVAEPHP
jgi:hypothetical protein